MEKKNETVATARSSRLPDAKMAAVCKLAKPKDPMESRAGPCMEGPHLIPLRLEPVYV
jgi:hypothetical protein